jgi:hypothetical protein
MIMIETKEGTRRMTYVQLAHNNLTVFNDSTGGVWKPLHPLKERVIKWRFILQRIGDSITVRGLLITFYVETSLQRTNVHFNFFSGEIG